MKSNEETPGYAPWKPSKCQLKPYYLWLTITSKFRAICTNAQPPSCQSWHFSRSHSLFSSPLLNGHFKCIAIARQPPLAANHPSLCTYQYINTYSPDSVGNCTLYCEFVKGTNKNPARSRAGFCEILVCVVQFTRTAVLLIVFPSTRIEKT